MFKNLFWLFLIVPIVELYLLIKVGGVLGAWPTIGLVLGAAVTGAAVLRWQGVVTWQRISVTMARGQLPARDMVEGVLLFAAGILLLTPGFLSDIVALSLLVNPVRRVLAGWVLSRMFLIRPPVTPPSSAGRRDNVIIDGQYRREDQP